MNRTILVVTIVAFLAVGCTALEAGGAAATTGAAVVLGLLESGTITQEQCEALLAAMRGDWTPAITAATVALAGVAGQHVAAKRKIEAATEQARVDAVADVMSMRGPTEAQRAEIRGKVTQ